MVYCFDDGEGGEAIAIALTDATRQDSISEAEAELLEVVEAALGFIEQSTGVWLKDYGEQT